MGRVLSQVSFSMIRKPTRTLVLDPTIMSHNAIDRARLLLTNIRTSTLRGGRFPYNVVLAVMLLGGAGACKQPAPVMPPPEVTVAPAVDKTVTDWDEFTGHFEAVQSVEVRPRVSGFVQRVSFAEGATVHA